MGERSAVGAAARTGGGIPVRRLLALAALIVGLLGMHTLSAAPSGHGSAAPTQSIAAGHHASHAMTDAAAAGHDDGDGAAQPAPTHDHTAMITCVLALLAGLVLLLPPARGGAAALLVLPRLASRAPGVVGHAMPPPSLVLLSISRT
ncbi:DUF6153 family protein [Agrococcus carbonis]|uniref:Uncharacterized protein n=1 Tax=Agrococcus carbonis TaxID=684552 RepID=A0A1H1NLH0_9MICO|nr:DUF6153 family protein [Agrococcus carbonis]SDR99844.1 hypothetical protein SAMN04489719_1303 [Agrococcus carbonis]